MTAAEIERVTALMQRYGIAEFDYEAGGSRLSLRIGAIPMADTPVTEGSAPQNVITAPSVGIFLLSHPAHPEMEIPFPRTVGRGDLVGYIKTGLTLRAVRAIGDGMIDRLISDGTGVGYGEPLFSYVTGS